MAYTNVFPVNYQPYYPQGYQSQAAQQNAQQMQNTGIIWVQGEAGAKSYLVAPNTTVQLWDSEAQVIYLKSSDASGMPSMKIIDYTIRDQAQPQIKQTSENYVTVNDFNVLKDELESLKHQIHEIKTARQKKGAKSDE